MKAFFASIFLAFSSLFGIGQNTPEIKVYPTPTIIQIPSNIPTGIDKEPTSTVKPTVIIKPTIAKPKSVINEEILGKFFGITDKGLINQVLNDKAQLNKYEEEYYQKYRTLPIPRLALDLKKQYGMPSKNGMVICTGNQLKSLYDEIRNIENDVYKERMDQDCHSDAKINWSGRKYKPESVECQNWRRDNDQNRVVPTKGSLDDAIANAVKKDEEIKSTYDRLLEKYCIKN